MPENPLYVDEFIKKVDSQYFAFLVAVDALDPEVDISAELQTTVTHFRKLKTRYLALETRRLILKKFASKDNLESISFNQLDKLSNELSKSEDEEKLLKSEIKDLKRKIDPLISDISQLWRDLETTKDDIAKLLPESKLLELREEYEQNLLLDHELGVFGGMSEVDLQLDSKEKLEIVKEAQHKFEQELLTKEKSLNKKIEDYSTDFLSFESQIKKLDKEMEHLSSTKTSDDPILEEKKAEMYKVKLARDEIGTRNGLSIDMRRISDGEIKVTYTTTPMVAEVKINVKFTKERKMIVINAALLVDSQVCSRQDVMDIIEFGIRKQKLNFIVRKIQGLLLESSASEMLGVPQFVYHM